MNRYGKADGRACRDAINSCFSCLRRSLQRRRFFGGDVPEHNMVVRVGYSWMAVIVVDIDVVRLCPGGGQPIEGLAGPEVLEGDHVDRAYEVAPPVICQKRARRQGRG